MTSDSTSTTLEPTVDQEQLRDCLRQVVDPEVGVNIVALGLIYRLDISAQGVVIDMTMTSPACPLGDLIVRDVHPALNGILPPAMPREVRLVWDPPWNSSMMDAATKQHFGWAGA